MIPCSLCRNPCSAESEEDGLLLETEDKVRRQCNVIFLVKNLLRIPLPQCAELLRDYGDPEGWINLCSPCTSILNQALDINEQINQLGNKIKELGEQLALPLKIKLEKNEEWEGVTPPAAQEIRRIVFNAGEGEDFPGPRGKRELKKAIPKIRSSITTPDDEDEGHGSIRNHFGDGEDYYGSSSSSDNSSNSNSNDDDEEEKESESDQKYLSSSSRRRVNRKRRSVFIKTNKEPGQKKKKPKHLEVPKATEKLKCISVGSFIIGFRELEGPTVLSCLQPRCGFKAKSKSSIMAHLKNAHEIEDWKAWITTEPKNISDMVSSSPEYEIKEEKEEEEIFNVLMITCKLCPKRFYHSWRHRLIAHLKMHQIILSTKCGDKEFFKHADTCVEPATVIKSILPSTDHKVVIHCPFCQFTSESPYPMKLHVQGTHGLSFCEVIPKDGEDVHSLKLENDKMLLVKPKKAKVKHHMGVLVQRFNLKEFLCDQPGCEDKFGSYKEWKEHKNRNHSAGYPCSECGKVLLSLTMLENHHRFTHFDKSLFHCPGGCGTDYQRRVDMLQTHLNRSSADCLEKSVPCPSCTHRLENQTALDIHMKVRHLTNYPDPDPFKCQHCGKAFKSMTAAYRNHVKSHTEDMSAICHQCGRQFKSPRYLSEHVRIVHGKPKEFKCSQCFRTFKYRRSQQQHEKLHGKSCSIVGSNHVQPLFEGT